ncbi:CAMK protein kinase [Cryptococcus gattii E566]|uniref:Protein kinase domain-containing protein n=2 Tax=Cryptococcus gattii TaxID=37769 RepID=E6R948_CRYGW|nr:Hypothetical protein CGB_G1510C [Cryptococcus gattii WM276]ADV23340.1 Hypothetical protein CGB_G1510C [Cryptococcus gattii WM276]KIR77918.1 CAMK protein kinase [Cryptococcus gattii EJB2]KIY32001.1 CAMK protein kinase [Cryptococcus gattii E566]KJE03267.1 CAMK protein kinase [Cryptococcus gattii NT-10]
MLHASNRPPPPSHVPSQQPSTSGIDSAASSPKQSPASLFIQRLHASRPTGHETASNSSRGAESSAQGAVSTADLGGMAGLRGRGGVSFGEAGSSLSPQPSHGQLNINTSVGNAPSAASRHPLFSHHAAPARPSSSSPAHSISPSFLSDPGPSGPPSPSISDLSSSAFSPASAFLSHFSSSSSATQLAPDAEGAKVKDYTLGKLVGRGGFSTVRKATLRSSGKVLACKIVKRDDLSDKTGSVEKFEEEIRTWQNLPPHPSLLPLLDMHRTPSATFLFTPYLPGGSLLDVLNREGGSDKTARRWFPGVVAAVSAMHEGFPGFPGGLLHGDLKLDNFLVDHQGKVMVCDFYMAQMVGRQEDRPTTIPPPLTAGVNRHSTLPSNFSRGSSRMPSPYRSHNSHTPHRFPNEHHLHENSHAPSPSHNQSFPSASLPYAPPELLRAPPLRPSLAQDIWAIGVVLHALLTGRLPFFDPFDPRLQMKILRGTWDEPPNLGKEWLECLKGCLDGDRERRWTIVRVKGSDAVLGWKEVQSRSKSRSRSRVRIGRSIGMGDGFMDPTRRDGVSQPMPIMSSSSRNPRGKKSASVSRSRDRGHSFHGGVFPGEHTRTPFDHPHHHHHALHLQDPPPPPRSRSASASRSRSSGHLPIFTFDAPELSRNLEQVDLNRGRSTHRGIPPGAIWTPSVPASNSSSSSLSYARPQGATPSNQGTPFTIQPADASYSRAASRSRSQSANKGGGMLPQSAPVQSSGFKGAMGMGLTESGLGTGGAYGRPTGPAAGVGVVMPIPVMTPNVKSRSRSRRSQASTSPSVSRSRSQARDSPSLSVGGGSGGHMGWAETLHTPWAEASPAVTPGLGATPQTHARWNSPQFERYEYGQELGAVHEEDRGRDRGVRSREASMNREQRDQSRGRRGRPSYRAGESFGRR